jgi:pectinesterase
MRMLKKTSMLWLAAALCGGACVAGAPADDGGLTGVNEGAGGSSAGTGGGTAGTTGSGGMTTNGAGGAATGAGGAKTGAGGMTTTGAGGTQSGSGGAMGAGGRTGTGGATGMGGAPAGTGGATGVCTPIASTATRPQLTAAQAANDTILKYLAQTGTLGALTTDNWNPTAGIGTVTSFPADLVVAADGSGTHTTVQAALTAATGTARRYILVKPGTYREKVTIATQTPITIYGTGAATAVTIINSLDADAAGGTPNTATLMAKNNGFQIANLTISNDFPTPASPPAGSSVQAVALYTTGDKVVLQNVRLHGFQDTLFIDSPSATTVSRVYIKSSFIEGDTDFIFGRATAVIDGSTINYLSSRKGTGSGVHMAPSTVVANNFGFLVTGCNFTSDATAPANKISLGRSWDQGGVTPTPNGQAVVRESTLGSHINRTSPWAAAATSARPFSATGNRFGEYCNTGPGAGP